MPIADRHFPNLLKASRAQLEARAKAVTDGNKDSAQDTSIEEVELDVVEVDNTIRNGWIATYALQEDVTMLQEQVSGAIRRGELAKDDTGLAVNRVASATRSIMVASSSSAGLALVSPTVNRLPFVNASLQLDGGTDAPEYDFATKALTIRGALNITGVSTLTGNVIAKGTLTVTGAATFAATVAVTGNTTLTGTLAVTGTTTLEGLQIIDNTATEALLVRKNADGGDVFTVNTTTAGVLIAGTLNVTGALTLTVPLAVPQGGTGAATFTDGGLMLGSGTGILTVLARGSAGQMLIGSTSGDPVMGTLGGTADEITVTTGDGTITLSQPTDVTIGGILTVTGNLNHDGSNIGFFGTAPAVQAGAYTRNATVVEDRTLLASASATTLNNNNVLAALIADLQSYGLIQ